MRTPGSRESEGDSGGDLVIENARIYPSPDAPPIDPGWIAIKDGRIAEVADRPTTSANGSRMDARGGVVLAGFWNTHVHFTEARWRASPAQSADALSQSVSDMLTSRGFTTAVDLGSDLRVTLSLRDRIGAGEVLGPKLYVGGSGVFPPRGIPFYLRESLPWPIRRMLPQPKSPAAASRYVARSFAQGADVLKLFTGSYVERGKIVPMPIEIASAAAGVAHARGRLVFAHPSNLDGTLIARDAGVDVLAHAPSSPKGVDASILRSLVTARMAMIPTLKMFGTTVTNDPAFLRPIYEVVHEFSDLGGELLFGTDVGYMTDYSTGGEFEALSAAGLDWRGILRMLTTGPAQRFGVLGDRGIIAPGRAADMVLVEGDPEKEIGAFSRVRTTIRNGRILWDRT